MEAKVSDSLRSLGFLAPEIREVITQIRGAHAAWLGVAEDLSALGTRILFAMKPRRTSHQELLVAVLYGRCLAAHQTAIILSERGLALEARYVTRAMLEAVFAIVAVARVEGFADAYIKDDRHRHLRLINSYLKLPPDFIAAHGLDLEGLRTTAANLRAELKAEGSQILHVADIAKKADMEGHYNSIYALLCLASHSNVRDFDRYLDIGSDGNVRGLGWGPSDHQVEDVLMQSCEFLFIAVRCAVDLFKVDAEKEIEALWARYNGQIEKVPGAPDV